MPAPPIARACLRAGQLDALGLERCVDHVGDPMVCVDGVAGQRIAGNTEHADRCGIDDPGRLRNGRFRRLVVTWARPVPKWVASASTSALARSKRLSFTKSVADSQIKEGEGHGAACAPGADQGRVFYREQPPHPAVPRKLVESRCDRCCIPAVLPSGEITTVFTAPIWRASADTSSRSGNTASLQG